MGISMKEIAELANVNVSTVSRVFNKSSKISPETKEKILKLMDKLDYHPNISAWRLRKQKTSTIGICIPTGEAMLSSDFCFGFYEMLRGITNTIRGAYDILLQVPNVGDKMINYIRLFEQQKVDGIVIIFPSLNNPGLRVLEEREVPVVLINRIAGKLDYVKIDNIGSTLRVMDYLVELGRKRIGIIVPRINSASFEERFEGYKLALEKHNIPYNEDLVAYVTSNEEAMAYDIMEKMLIHRPDAIYASGDFLAVGVMKAIKEAGLDIPEDIAIVGFDDNPLASTITPQLTTVRQPYFELGKEAAKILVSHIEEFRGQQKKVLPGELIVRASTSKL